MRQSKLLTKTVKQAPKDEISKNAQLLARAGFIHKEMAGVYSFLPLGLRVIEKIKNIIRQEINAIGGQEMFMTTLQDQEIWKLTDRWSEESVDAWFKTELKNKTQLGLAWSHEEPMTRAMLQYINSYKDLPFSAYQFQTKLRNETRAKSGILRTREFIMKDLYSFSRTETEHEEFYQQCSDAYLKIFEKIGLGELTYITFSSGGPFSKYSHEFQTLVEAGEDTIYLNRAKKIAINKEVYSDEVIADLNLKKEDLEEVNAAEVGNIFSLKTKYSEPLGLDFTDENGQKQTVVMGSYGIGVARLMGVVVEAFADDNGIVWPESISPFKVHLVSLCREAKDIDQANKLYNSLLEAGIEVLYDDRDGVRPGEKFSDSDLIGISKRIVISPKTLEKNSVEIKERTGDQSSLLDLGKIVDSLK